MTGCTYFHSCEAKDVIEHLKLTKYLGPRYHLERVPNASRECTVSLVYRLGSRGTCANSSDVRSSARPTFVHLTTNYDSNLSHSAAPVATHMRKATILSAGAVALMTPLRQRRWFSLAKLHFGTNTLFLNLTLSSQIRSSLPAATHTRPRKKPVKKEEGCIRRQHFKRIHNICRRLRLPRPFSLSLYKLSRESG